MALDLPGGQAQRPAPRPRSPLLNARRAQDKAHGTAWPPRTSNQIHPCGSVLGAPFSLTCPARAPSPSPPIHQQELRMLPAEELEPSHLCPCGPQ